MTTDVIVRDAKNDQFMADLKPTDFDIFEDGVKQELASMVLIHGGRAYNTLAPPPAPLQEGIILPVARPTNDAAGRVFLLFVDDLHMDFQNTPRIREIFRKMLKNLIHDGDMWGMVSTGTSSISIDLTYDRALLDDAINRISGNGLKPTRDHQGAGRAGRPDRAALPRARRVHDGEPVDAEPREAAQPPQGCPLGQQRLRLQSRSRSRG